MFARRGVLSLDGFLGSGADWLERFKPYIENGRTVVVRPGPEQGGRYSPGGPDLWSEAEARP